MGIQAHGEMDCYSNFYRARKAQGARYIDAFGETARILNQQWMRDEEEMCDISKEIKHLREIKDIRDELKMIKCVLEDQLAVTTHYRESLGTGLETSEFNRVGALQQSLDFRLSKLQWLNKDAEAVENSVSKIF